MSVLGVQSGLPGIQEDFFFKVDNIINYSRGKRGVHADLMLLR